MCAMPFQALDNTTVSPSPAAALLYQDTANISCAKDHMVPLAVQTRVCQTQYSLQCQANGSTTSLVGATSCILKACAAAPLLQAIAARNQTLTNYNNQAYLPLNSSVLMWCRIGTRPDSNLLSANRFYQLSCGSDCGFSTLPLCVPVQCDASNFRPLNGNVSWCICFCCMCVRAGCLGMHVLCLHVYVNVNANM
jgi:hypothetical protein